MSREEIIQEIHRLLKKHGQYPQGMQSLGIKGRRDSDMRYKLYGLDEILTPDMTVLDIGCNCGFLSCLIAKHVGVLIGIDIDGTLIKTARLASKALDIDNCTFLVNDFKSKDTKVRYDLVIASQIHYWVGMPFRDYAAKLRLCVNPDGYLLFESHDTTTVDRDLNIKLDVLQRAGFTIIKESGWTEDPGKYFVPPKEHKLIPRKCYLMKAV